MKTLLVRFLNWRLERISELHPIPMDRDMRLPYENRIHEWNMYVNLIGWLETGA